MVCGTAQAQLAVNTHTMTLQQLVDKVGPGPNRAHGACCLGQMQSVVPYFALPCLPKEEVCSLH